MTTQPVMIMVAPTGSRVGKNDNPTVPLTPTEIADEVVRCAQAGASIAHLHARDAQGKPTQSADTYREIIERIRERSDIVVQISLGTPGFSVEEALQPIRTGADMASLPLKGFLDDDPVAHAKIRQMAESVRDSRVRPELSIYDDKMLAGALSLIACGAVLQPACFGLILKSPAAMREGEQQVRHLVDQLPEGARWWFAKGGDFGLELRELAIDMGGNVRVGFEDSIRDFDGTRLAPGNAWLVERMVTLCAKLGRAVATPAEARNAVRA
jgi:3-keto-5-aminohexanoate cleavage enzyme